MRSCASPLNRLAIAALALSGVPACSLELGDSSAANLQRPVEPASYFSASRDPSSIVVQPARVPVVGSPSYYERLASLPPPPPGPIASRLVISETAGLRAADRARSGPAGPPPTAISAPAPDTAFSAPTAAPPVAWQDAPEVSMAASAPVAAAAKPEKPASQPPASSAADAIAVISFAPQSPNLTDAMRKELDDVAKRIADRRLRYVELRAFATGDALDSRKIALARALVVRSYLMDRGVKTRIEVGSFAGEGEHVEVLIPRS